MYSTHKMDSVKCTGNKDKIFLFKCMKCTYIVQFMNWAHDVYTCEIALYTF